MTLYHRYAEAWGTKNIDMLSALCHPNFEMVMHSSGSVASNKEYLEPLRPLIQKFTAGNRRYLYENDNVMIIHFIM